MLTNYIKVALAVLGRNRFFTFVSLFGISLTLAVLIIVSAFLNQFLNPSYPNLNKDRVLMIKNVGVKGEFGSSISSASFYLYENHIKKLKTPEIIGVISQDQQRNVFVGNQKLKLRERLSDANFFEIMDFDFIEGKAYDESHIERNEFVAVISKSLAEDYFGTAKGNIGKSITIEQTTYKLIGVVKDAPSYNMLTSADIFLPYNVSKSDLSRHEIVGQFIPLLLAKNYEQKKAIRTEAKALIPKVPFPPDAWYEEMSMDIGTITDFLAKVMVDRYGEMNETNINKVYAIIFGAMILFMLLPTLNLINLNSGRIVERASEIGVRKAFGATSSTLAFQFIIENIIITLIGGAIGLLLAFGVLKTIEVSGSIPHGEFPINFSVFAYGIFLCFLFGILSGVVPALRMSKMSIVSAIKKA